MKLVLINPVDKHTCAYSASIPPLSLAYVAALTPPEWEIDYIDENYELFSPRKADLVAVSVMTIQANRAYEICSVYKKMGVPVVVGGIHVSMMAQEALKYATSVVIGEAESLWPGVIEDFTRGKLKPIYRNETYPSLDNLVIPRRDIFSNKYKYATILTSRGCPFNCDFCSVTVFNGRKFRLRPVEEVVEELKTIKNRLLFFVDDNIIGVSRQDEERAMELFEAIIRSGIKKYWISQASVNVTKNDKLLRLMKRSGCQGLLIGFESLDPAKLKQWGKTQNIRPDGNPGQLYRHVIRKMHEHKMAVNGYFCYGYEDTPESIEKTHKFIMSAGVDVVNTPIIVPSPGTTLFRELNDRIEYKNFPEDWSKYLGRLVYRPKYSSKKEFYTAYIRSNEELISLKAILRRAFFTFRHTKSCFLALIMFLINLNYKKLRREHIDVVLRQDPDFQAAYEELRKC